MGRIWRVRAGLGALVAAMAMGTMALPASAVGSPSLDHRILHDPWAGSVPLPSTTLDASVHAWQAAAQALSHGKASVAIAAQGWHAVASTSQVVQITLLEVSAKRSQVDTTALAAQIATSITRAFCGTTSSTTPFVTKPAPLVPHSTYVICSTSSSGTNVEGIITSRANVTEIVATTVQALAPLTLQSITRQQYDALPATAPAAPVDPPKAWTLRRELGVAAAVGSGAIALTLLWVLLRDRRRQRRAWEYLDNWD